MQANYLSIKNSNDLSIKTSNLTSICALSFTNPDGSIVEIGRNDSKNVKIETRDGVLWVSLIS